MTRRDYNKLAYALSKSRNVIPITLFSKLVLDVADELAEDNVRFNRDRFYLACTMGLDVNALRTL